MSEGDNTSDKETPKSGRLRKGRPPGRRSHNGNLNARILEEATKADIIEVATAEFVRTGYDGASINVIASKTKTSKMMLYYHFENKAGLYRAVLEAAYQRMVKDRPSEDLTLLPPLDGLRRYAERAFELHFTHPDFVRLVMAENLNDARTISSSDVIRTRTAINISELDKIVDNGKRQGVIRQDCDAKELYLVINGLAFHAVSNMATLRISMGLDLNNPEVEAFRKRLLADVAYRFAVQTEI